MLEKEDNSRDYHRDKEPSGDFLGCWSEENRVQRSWEGEECLVIC